ncbi:ABC transporter permease [Knoellia sp. S7-12]|uniref:ABC transporter permease n=1 Tax=Knoellia sp. S7-12 TaxID=3126698 RepID=UPI003368D12C
MTTTDTRTPAVDPASAARPVPTPGQDGRPGVPLSRLINVELRKMVDTRAGRWMLIVMSAISLVVVTVLLIWGEADEMTYGTFLGFTSLPLVMLLPIVGIMAATAEWSQRTGLVTFTLEPRRGRVIVAKIVAAVILGLIVTATAFAASALANVIGGGVAGGDGTWDVTWTVAVGVIVAFAIYVLQGLAFGFVFLNTPFAIVASLLLPTLWTVATSLVQALQEPSKWLDLNQVTGPLFEGTMTGENWGQLATSFGVWVLLPLVIGSYRVMHREVK